MYDIEAYFKEVTEKIIEPHMFKLPTKEAQDDIHAQLDTFRTCHMIPSVSFEESRVYFKFKTPDRVVGVTVSGGGFVYIN